MYYAQNYAGIICLGLILTFTITLHGRICIPSTVILKCISLQQLKQIKAVFITEKNSSVHDF